MSRPEARFRVARPAAVAVALLLLVIAALGLVAMAPGSAAAKVRSTCAAPTAATKAAAAGKPFIQTRAVDQRHAVTLLFLPAPVRTPQAVLTTDLQRLPGFSVGLLPVSPPAPGMVLDERTQTARFKGWQRLLARADDVPAEVSPGLLGCAIEAHGDATAWVSVAGESTIGAIAAVAGDNTVRRAERVTPRELTPAIERLQRDFSVVAAQLPPGGFGLGAIRRLSAAQPERMLIVVQAPPNPARTRLLSIGVRGLGDEGGITSATTRRNGLVAATDIAATIIDRTGARRPSEMQGRPIEGASRQSADELRAMSARLELISGRRLPFGRGVMFMFCLLLIGVLGAARLTGRYTELASRMQRLIGLSLLWLPLSLLLTSALRPSRGVEVDIAVFGSLGLALVNDRLVRWPRAPWVPVVCVLASQAVDFALLGSRYIGESLLGSNPLYGARFFGAGNELEVVLTVSSLIGLGAWLCDRPARHSSRWFAVAGVAMALFLGLGRLGADVGGVVMVGAGFGVAATYVARLRLTAWRIALLALLPVAGLALIMLLDAISGGESHLTRTVQGTGGAGDLVTVILRRFKASIEGARNDGVWMIVLVAIALLAWAWVRRDRLMAPLTAPGEDPAARRPYRAALIGGIAATVVGALANDSGPAIMIIGTVYLSMGLLYLRGRPAR
ncbi:MAG: hypothetical protein HZB14_09375 [Actinobacteria bacterium]|nr:hypothetical protein [Actinomycetota bacterium]